MIDRREFLKRLGGVTLALVLANRFGECVRRPREGLPAAPEPRWDPASAEIPVRPGVARPALFPTVMLGGFECSTHVRRDGTRLDLIASSGHDRWAEQDYARLQSMGMGACRDAARWHLVERRAGYFQFASLLSMARAARDTQMQVIWDLMHYGWPEHVDLFGGSFPTRFAKYAVATARVLDEYTPPGQPLFITPINEISFLAWAGGDTAYLNPFEKGRGSDMKRQLVRAAIEAMHGIREVCPRAKFVHCDPLIHVVARGVVDRAVAASYRMAQFQALDMIRGTIASELGGSPALVDVIGLNYYRNNQTYYDGTFIHGDESNYKPLSTLLQEVWERYRTPLLLAETGIEDDERPRWMRYIAGECGLAMQAGVQLHGITWYPIVDHLGWNDDRYCHNGLWSSPSRTGERKIYLPLARGMICQAPALTRLRDNVLKA